MFAKIQFQCINFCTTGYVYEENGYMTNKNYDNEKLFAIPHKLVAPNMYTNKKLLPQYKDSYRYYYY